MGIQANSVLSREGSRYKLPGPGYLAYVLIFSRSVLVEGPEKNCLARALTRSRCPWANVNAGTGSLR